MSFSRREFVRRLASAERRRHRLPHHRLRARRALRLRAGTAWRAAAGQRRRRASLSSNENLRGPGPKVLEVLRQHPSRTGSRISAAQRRGVRRTPCGDLRRQTEKRHRLDRVGRNPTAAVMAYCDGEQRWSPAIRRMARRPAPRSASRRR